MVRVQIYTHGGVELLGDMNNAEIAGLIARWNEAKSGDDGVIDLVAVDSGRKQMSHVLLSEVAAIKYAETFVGERQPK